MISDVWYDGNVNDYVDLTWPIKAISSRWKMFFKIAVLKNFTNFTEKHLGWSLQCARFAVKFAKFLRIPFFTEHLPWLLLKIMKFQFTN